MHKASRSLFLFIGQICFLFFSDRLNSSCSQVREDTGSTDEMLEEWVVRVPEDEE